METPGTDDYSLGRVPQSARRAWFGIAMQRFGQLSALVQFLLGAILGFGLTFWNAFWALTIGAVIVEVVAIAVGIIGAREGMSSSLLIRWTGFGSGGGAIISLLLGLFITAGFGIQSGISAAGLVAIFGTLPAWAWSIIFGLVVTAIVVFGIKSLAWTAYLTVPVFLLLVAWSIGTELSKHSLGELASSAPAGPPLTIGTGATLVVGSIIVGAVITPDMSRFNRSAADVVKQTVVGFTLGEYLVGLSGVLLAHAIGSNDVIAIVVSSVGWVGVLVILLGTVKINDWNLYSASLALVTFVEGVSGRKVHRAVVSVVLGVIGSIAAAAGALGWFAEMSAALAYIVPPIAGIMVAEYFVVKRFRRELDESRESGSIPASAPRWVPATLVVWVVAALLGAFPPLGSPSLVSLVAGLVLYVVAGKAGLLREVGRREHTVPDAAPAAS
jgi:cytosine permease